MQILSFHIFIMEACDDCNSQHHNDKILNCGNCNLKVCHECFVTCTFCKRVFCHSCTADDDSLMTTFMKIDPKQCRITLVIHKCYICRMSV